MKILIPFLLLTLLSCREETTQNPNKYLNVGPNPTSQVALVTVRNLGAPFTLKGFDYQGKVVLNESPAASSGQYMQYQVDVTKQGTYYFILQINGVTEKQTVIHP